MIQDTSQKSYAEAFLVNRSQLQENEKVSKILDHSGMKCLDWYKSVSPLGSLVRMLLTSPIWHSKTHYLTWKVKATKHNRLLFQLQQSMHPIEETAYGSLPTPTVQDGGKATKRWREDRQNNLTAVIFNPHKMIPTPALTDYKGAPKNRYQGSSTYKANLSEAVRFSESSPTHVNPEFLESVMGFPVGWTELKR